MPVVDALGWEEFERLLASLFERQGYAVERTQYFDYGADLVVERAGERVAVQAKRYSRPVGERAVRDVVAALPVYRCNSGLVVTTSSFTPRARELARFHPVELWDGRRLRNELGQVAPAAPRRRGGPRCAACDSFVTPKVARSCLDRPDRFAGRVYCFDHQRTLVGVLR